MSETIDEIREQRARIDRLDEQIVGLLNERARCALAIGRAKRATGLAVYQPQREAEILARLRGKGSPLSDGALCRVFERIIDESRGLERSVLSRAEAGAAGDAMERNRRS